MSDTTTELITSEDRRKPRAVLQLVGGVLLGSLLTLAFLTSVAPNRTGSGGSASRPVAQSTPATAKPKGTTAGSTSGPGSSAMGAQMSSAGTSMSVLDALLTHIPPTIRPTCAAGDNQHVGDFAYASVICHPGLPMKTLQYSWFHDVEAMRTKYVQDRTEVTSKLVHGLPICSATGVGGFGAWWMAKTVTAAGGGRHEITLNPPKGYTNGQLMCYLTPTAQTATLEWYDGDTHIYGWATTSQDLSLAQYTWWVNSAGPWHPSMTQMMDDAAALPSSARSGAASAPASSPTSTSMPAGSPAPDGTTRGSQAPTPKPGMDMSASPSPTKTGM